jgi:uncharacterized repeat protein (TIGR03809 family)
MTHHLDVARGRDNAARWCALAEQRLEHLTELFETGRWRRYHSELAFLENIQEAKTAVEIWRDLSTREASRDNPAVGISWPVRATVSPKRERSSDQVHRLAPESQPAQSPAEPPPSAISIVPEADPASATEAPLPSAMDMDHNVAEPTPGMTAIAERYPLLRNAL